MIIKNIIVINFIFNKKKCIW